MTPEIDLPTVIFALVALFVAWKLRSVLGMRQDLERPGGLLAPLRRVPGPSNPAVAQPEAPTSAPVPSPAADRWKGVAVADPAVWSGLDAIAGADRGFSPQAFLSRRSLRLRHGRPRFRGRRFRRPRKPDGAGGLRQFRERDPRPRRRRANHVDHGRLGRRPDDRRPRAFGQTARISVRFAAKLVSVTRAPTAPFRRLAQRLVDHVDLWRFVRDVRSRDPNWQLTATIGNRSRAATVSRARAAPPRVCGFRDPRGLRDDDHLAALRAFEGSARALAAGDLAPGECSQRRPNWLRTLMRRFARPPRLSETRGFLRDRFDHSALFREWPGIPDRILRALRPGFEG